MILDGHRRSRVELDEALEDIKSGKTIKLVILFD